MKNKNKIIAGVVLVVLIIAMIAVQMKSKQSKYGSEMTGIPVYENSLVTQDDIKEDEIGNTQGIRSYKLEGFKGSLEDVDKFYKENVDKSLWEIEETKKDKDNYYMKLKPKSKEIQTKVNITVLKSKDKLFTVITSEL